MKKLLSLMAALVAAYLLATGGIQTGEIESQPGGSRDAGETAPSSVDAKTSLGVDRLGAAFERQQSGVQVESEGEVARVLADDNDGSRHQRIILRLQTGQTVLIAHNIDLAPRVEGLRPGERVAFFGEYEWNPQGGVVHWTHRDPAGEHVAGWLEVEGRRYQ